ncbi:MAG: NADH:ubiquinone reductase (Na(+)-transporting) subunit D [Candidatus Rifleibacteriota bacterium]
MNFWGKIWYAMVPNNPVFGLALGLCSTLAVTTGIENAFFMSVMVTFTIVFSSVTVSIIRYQIPFRFRLLVYMLIVSTAVISSEQILRAFYPEVARALGPYVGLIITNCIVLGRLEAFASCNSPWGSFLDAIGVGCGYGAVLLLMAAIREFFGNGTLWGLKAAPAGYIPCRILNSPPGAFLVLAGLIFLINYFKPYAGREK